MKKVYSHLTGETYKDNTRFEKFLLYKICYPIVNRIGLNRKFNLLVHKFGFYGELPNRLCKWCGQNHRITPLSKYKDETHNLINLEINK